MDLDSQVNNLFLKSHNIVQKTAMNWRLSARNAARRDSVLAASRDYRNIIERLQVMLVLREVTLGLARCPLSAEGIQESPWGQRPVWPTESNAIVCGTRRAEPLRKSRAPDKVISFPGSHRFAHCSVKNRGSALTRKADSRVTRGCLA